MRKPDAASCKTRCVASPLRSTTSIAPAVATYGTMRVFAALCELVQPIEIRRIGHRDVQISVLAPQRHELISHHQIDRNFAQKRIIDRRLAVLRQQIYEWQAITPREVFCLAHLRRLDRLAGGRRQPARRPIALAPVVRDRSCRSVLQKIAS